MYFAPKNFFFVFKLDVNVFLLLVKNLTLSQKV